MNKKQLIVRFYDQPIGIFEQTLSGKMQFHYLETADRPISMSMPISDKIFSDSECEAFFGGLLPESISVRKIIAKRYGISANNTFALLKAIGYDCAGAISFHADKDTHKKQGVLLKGKIVSDKTLYQHIKELPQKPLFLDFEGYRLSLAGVQEKAAVCIIDGAIAIPQDGCPSSHILKPAVREFPGSLENEFFCLRVAKQLGISTPEVEIRQLKDISFLLIERYDRKITNNMIERIHQEDFCQALGISSRIKYQADGGPGFTQCFGILQNTTQPALDRNKLVDAIVFNYLICNMDAHAKNFSLLHNKQSIKLAPFYDLLCTTVYTNLTAKMAMKIGSKYRYDEVLARHFEQFCRDINYSYPALKQIFKKQSGLILDAADKERDFLLQIGRDVAIIDKIVKIIERQVSRIEKLFK